MFKVLLIVMAVISISASAEEPNRVKELFFVNQAGGAVVLTVEPCQIPAAMKRGFEGRTYATEANGTKHEGCWMPPADITNVDAKPGSTVFAVVNVWYDGIITPFKEGIFLPFNKIEGAI